MNILVFDKSNKQQEFMHMAKSLTTGKYEIGYIVIDKPWYSSESAWTYYIVKNKYGSGGVCGGATDLGLEQVIVDGTTAVPFTQTANIIRNQAIGMTTKLVKKSSAFARDEDVIAVIKPEDKIPYELWG